MDNTTSPNTANTSGLGFRLELRTDVWVVQYDSGGCHPANADEIKLWHALEAAEAELTRRDTVIEQIRSGVARRLDQNWDDTQSTETDVWRSLEWIDGLIADHREESAAAPVSLEAVKAETTTEWSLESRGVRMPATTSEQLARATQMPWDTLVSREVTEWRPVSTEGDNRG